MAGPGLPGWADAASEKLQLMLMLQRLLNLQLVLIWASGSFAMICPGLCKSLERCRRGIGCAVLMMSFSIARCCFSLLMVVAASDAAADVLVARGAPLVMMDGTLMMMMMCIAAGP
jgi:hypothetical protein